MRRTHWLAVNSEGRRKELCICL